MKFWMKVSESLVPAEIMLMVLFLLEVILTNVLELIIPSWFVLLPVYVTLCLVVIQLIILFVFIIIFLKGAKK